MANHSPNAVCTGGAQPKEFCRAQQARCTEEQFVKQKVETLSAKQFCKGLKQGHVTYVAALVQTQPDSKKAVPKAMADILEAYADTMPAELPKCLPPRRDV